MPAGRFDDEYGERVVRFDWRRLFECAPSLIRVFGELLASKYDYILIDSRTGINDTSGICTTLLPDQLVLVFTPNRQSLIGGIDAVTRATHYRIQSEDIRPLAVFPLPSRIDMSEPDLLDKWRFGGSSSDGDERGYTPQSDYLYTLLGPLLEDLLFLGSEYETAFDRFEILNALEHGHRYGPESGTFRYWGPVGRFGWKRSQPLDQLIAEAEAEGTTWPPVQAGLFGGSIDRFKKVAAGYRAMMAGLMWH